MANDLHRVLHESQQDMKGCLLDTQGCPRMPKDSIGGCIIYRGRCCCFFGFVLTLPTALYTEIQSRLICRLTRPCLPNLNIVTTQPVIISNICQ